MKPHWCNVSDDGKLRWWMNGADLSKVVNEIADNSLAALWEDYYTGPLGSTDPRIPISLRNTLQILSCNFRMPLKPKTAYVSLHR